MSVEVTVKGPHITVRSSDKPKGKTLHWSWAGFEAAVKSGELSREALVQ